MDVMMMIGIAGRPTYFGTGIGQDQLAINPVPSIRILEWLMTLIDGAVLREGCTGPLVGGLFSYCDAASLSNTSVA